MLILTRIKNLVLTIFNKETITKEPVFEEVSFHLLDRGFTVG